MIPGKKVTLRALKKDDSETIINWINDPKLKYLTGTLFPVSEIEHNLWLEEKVNEKLNKMFGIQENNTENLIGIIGLKNTDLINRSTELYIYIGDEHDRGKGYGSDAIRTLADFIFNDLNLHRVSLDVFSYNKRAIGVYENQGFVVEGVLKESHFKNGSYHDKIIMALLNKKKDDSNGT